MEFLLVHPLGIFGNENQQLRPSSVYLHSYLKCTLPLTMPFIDLNECVRRGKYEGCTVDTDGSVESVAD